MTYYGDMRVGDGIKSPNPIIRSLDYLHGHDEMSYNKRIDLVFFVLMFSSFIAGLTVSMFGAMELGLKLLKYSSYFFLLFLFYPCWIYRHIRHHWFRKHHHPGPYGYGTLDRHPTWLYRDVWHG